MRSALYLAPVLRFKNLGPMHVEAQLIRIAPPAGQPPAQIGFRDLFAHAHLVVGREAPADHAARGAGHLDPIVHIVLFKNACRTEAVLRDEAHHVFDVRRRRLIDNGPTPDLHLVRSPWMPNAQGTVSQWTERLGKTVPAEGATLRARTGPKRFSISAACSFM